MRSSSNFSSYCHWCSTWPYVQTWSLQFSHHLLQLAVGLSGTTVFRCSCPQSWWLLSTSPSRPHKAKKRLATHAFRYMTQQLLWGQWWPVLVTIFWRLWCQFISWWRSTRWFMLTAACKDLVWVRKSDPCFWKSTTSMSVSLLWFGWSSSARTTSSSSTHYLKILASVTTRCTHLTS